VAATIIIVILTISCCALTVALLGALRGIAELRLRLVRAGSGADKALRLDSGRVLPEILVAALPDPHAATFVGFVSDDCAACLALLEQLDRLELPPDRVVLAVTGKDTGEVRRRFEGRAAILPSEVAHAGADELGLEVTPVVVIAAAGAVAAVGYGDSLLSLTELRRLWETTVQISHPEVF
jgi:hypothetical protein